MNALGVGFGNGQAAWENMSLLLNMKEFIADRQLWSN